MKTLTGGRSLNTLVGLALLLGTAMGCAQVRQVRPLEPGRTSVSVGFGGQLAQVPHSDFYVPVPMVNAGFNHGLSRHFDVEAGLQLTHLVFGMAALDYGVNWRPLLPSGLRPGLAISPGLNVLSDIAQPDLETLRVYPELGLTLSWETLDNWYTYAGAETWAELARVRSDGHPQPSPLLPVCYLGQTFGAEDWQVQVEGRLYTPHLSNDGRLPTFLGVDNHGIFGVFVGVSYSFGGA